MNEKQFLPREIEEVIKSRAESDDQKLKGGAKLVVDAGSDRPRLEFTDDQMKEFDFDNLLEIRRKNFEEANTPLGKLVDGVNEKGLTYSKKCSCYEANEYLGRDEEGKGAPKSTPYADDILKSLATREGKEVKPFLKELEGSMVVDIGSGQYGFGYYVAMECKARGYIGIDKFRKPEIISLPIAGGRGAFDADKVIPYALVEDDMLDFLRRLPSNSVSILTAGIELNFEEQFIEEIEREIVRVLDPHGAYVSVNSVFWPSGLVKSEFLWESTGEAGPLLKFTKPKE